MTSSHRFPVKADCEQNAKMFDRSCSPSILPALAAPYLDKLNPAQRRAATHGVGDAHPAPLLVIAGAGSGKTNTLAHRVAHLIVNGADPRRILLMTFSRRAARRDGAAASSASRPQCHRRRRARC